MKSDGHSKITRYAIRKVRQRFGKHLDGVILPTLEDQSMNLFANTSWVGGAALDAITFVYGEYSKGLEDRYGELPVRVVAPDLGRYWWTQAHPEGQRFHFMKSPFESEYQAWINACEFIQVNTEKWIQAALIVPEQVQRSLGQAIAYREQFDSKWARSSGEDLALKVERKVTHHRMMKEVMRLNLLRMSTQVEHLGLALHSLQDSFSPGHTVRSSRANFIFDRDDHEPLSPDEDSGTSYHPAPIRKIFNYELQDHEPLGVTHNHARADFKSGSLTHGLAQMAAYASIDLISLGIESILHKKKRLQHWGYFRNRWMNQEGLSLFHRIE
jgi:hypothetical protein